MTDMGELMDAALAVKPAPTDDRLWDHANVWFTTALEGGINYWAIVDVYHWDQENFHAVIRDTVDEDKQHTIDRAVIERGLGLYYGGYLVDGYGDKKHHVSADVREFIDSCGDDGDMDAGDADTVVQLGLFGKVVYG
jgi:hypothetical protein